MISFCSVWTLSMPHVEFGVGATPLFGCQLNWDHFVLQHTTDLTFAAACAPPGGGRHITNPRLLKHFWYVPFSTLWYLYVYTSHTHRSTGYENQYIRVFHKFCPIETHCSWICEHIDIYMYDDVSCRTFVYAHVYVSITFSLNTLQYAGVTDSVHS